MTATSTPRRGLGALLVLWLLNLARWHRATRPEPLPRPPAGSTTAVAADGTRLHAQIGGLADADTTIVFVHGFLARTIAFDMQWNHFTDKTRLVRYDHRNHGRSERTAKQIDIETLAGDLGDVIRQTAPTGTIVLVGHSMGGLTILAFALKDTRCSATASPVSGSSQPAPGTTSTAIASRTFSDGSAVASFSPSTSSPSGSSRRCWSTSGLAAPGPCAGSPRRSCSAPQTSTRPPCR